MNRIYFQLAETLLKKETLKYEDVEKLLGPPPYGKKNLVELGDFENTVTQAGHDEQPPSDHVEREVEQEASRMNSNS